MEVVNINPFSENEMEDKRNNIAENCFLDLEISLKIYKTISNSDILFEELKVTHSSLAYILLNHTKTKHNLPSIDIDKFVLPTDKYTDENGSVVKTVDKMSNEQKLGMIINLIVNCKKGLHELINSSYFEGVFDESKLLLNSKSLLSMFFFYIDKLVLVTNMKYNEKVLNFY